LQIFTCCRNRRDHALVKVKALSTVFSPWEWLREQVRAKSMRGLGDNPLSLTLLPGAVRSPRLEVLPGDRTHRTRVNCLLNEILRTSFGFDCFRFRCLATQSENLRTNAFTGATTDAFFLIDHDFSGHDDGSPF
jgi:hypothetical protein